MAVDLKNHPGANPNYERIKELRRYAIHFNQEWAIGFRRMDVPKLPNKYVPHIGAKQRAKGAK